MSWIFIVLIVLGDVLVILKNRNGFLLWAICDGFFCVNSYLNLQYPESCAFGIYAIIGIFGFFMWKKNEL